MEDTNDWKFDQGPNVAAITTKQVLEDGRPILRVTHYSDDDSWAFTCGTTNHSEDGRVVSMAQIVALDSSVKKISDLKPGWKVWRESVGSEWYKEEMND